MNQDNSEVRSLRWQEAGVGLYLLVAVGRLIYESVGSHGVYGWLADQQMQRAGHFDLKLTLAGAAAVYLLPASPILSHVKQLRARLAEEGILAPGTPDARRDAVRTARVFIGLGVALLLAGGVGYYMLTRQNEANAHRRVEHLSAETLAGLSPTDADQLRFVEVNATCQTRASYRWTETDPLQLNPQTHHRCLPLTPPDWRPGQPVRLFLQTTVDAYYPPDENSQPSASRDFDGEPFAGAFEGELDRDALPLFVRNALQRAGIAVASPCYVLTHQTLHGQPRLLSRQEMLLAPGLGGGLGLIFLLGGALMYWRREGYAARLAARRDQTRSPWR